MADDGIKALVFDVFGTVVDWRTSVAREAEECLSPKGYKLDWLSSVSYTHLRAHETPEQRGWGRGGGKK